MSQVSKFVPLTAYLCTCNQREVILSFSKIEDILGIELCTSARKHNAYWHPSKTHMLPFAWEAAGYELLKVDMRDELVTLRKK